MTLTITLDKHDMYTGRDHEQHNPIALALNRYTSALWEVRRNGICTRLYRGVRGDLPAVFVLPDHAREWLLEWRPKRVGNHPLSFDMPLTVETPVKVTA